MLQTLSIVIALIILQTLSKISFHMLALVFPFSHYPTLMTISKDGDEYRHKNQEFLSFSITPIIRQLNGAKFAVQLLLWMIKLQFFFLPYIICECTIPRLLLHLVQWYFINLQRTEFLKQCINLLLKVLIFIIVMQNAAAKLSKECWRPDLEETSKIKSFVKKQLTSILHLPIVTHLELIYSVQ